MKLFVKSNGKTAPGESAYDDDEISILYNAMPMGCNLWDRNQNIIQTNDEMVRLFGAGSKEEFIKLFPGLSPERQPDGSLSRQKGLEYIRKAFDEGYQRYEFHHKTVSGEPLPLETTLVRVKYKGEDAIAAYVRDLRESKAAEAEIRRLARERNEELELALQEARNASNAKSAFLANMSHEIRTPMNAILGITEIELRDESLTPEMEQGLEKIYDSGTLLLNIINDILDLSKIESGKLEVMPAKYDIPSLINDTVQLNRLRYDAKPIEFFLDVDENTPLNVYGDEMRLKQILNNILSNAFKYTDEGQVRLSVMPENKGGDDFDIIFRVSDTGQGMTPGQIATIFDKYTRFNPDTNRTKAGTGLGMSITKNLVDLMNGEIHVESEPGKGSVFTVRIPQKRTDSLTCGSHMAEKLKNFDFHSSTIFKKIRMFREHMPYGKVLIVDDVESNIYVTRGMLLPYGLDIDSVNSGAAAIDRIKDGKEYDIIFMDHMMPKADGIETTKAIRSLGYKNTIIALTANALVGQAGMFLSNGFDGYISKPIDSRELNLVLNEYVRNKKPPEVVRAARQEQKARGETPAGKSSGYKSQVHEFFALDAESAIITLEGIMEDFGSMGSEETDLYEITVHGIKSALLNIGEKELSASAYELELAVKAGEREVMEEKTPELIESLKILLEQVRN